MIFLPTFVESRWFIELYYCAYILELYPKFLKKASEIQNPYKNIFNRGTCDWKQL